MSKAYGVDPWSANAAEQFDRPEIATELAAFARDTDWDGIYSEVTGQCSRMGLEAHCTIVRKTSREAALDFTAEGIRFGMVHIDGNHDAVAVTTDIDLYLPLLAKGGFVVVDDISWPSIRGALKRLRTEMTPILELSTPDKMHDYAIYWSGGSSVERMMLGTALRQIALATG